MTNRYLWLDYIRAIAAILVVLLHTSASYLIMVKQLDPSDWMVGNVVDSFSRICVPLFFMISGYLFFRDKKPTSKNYLRVVLALLFYSMVSLAYTYFYLDKPIFNQAKNILFAPTFYHLWFFYVIVILYVIAGFVRIRPTDIKPALLFILLCFVAFNPRTTDFIRLQGLAYQSHFKLDGSFIYYLLFAAFGAILGSVEIKAGRWLKLYSPLLIYVALSLFIVYGTHFFSTQLKQFVGIYYEYTSVCVAIGAMSIFLAIKENPEILEPVKKPLLLIANNSLAIYGFHAIVLEIINQEGYRDFNNPHIDIPLVFGATLIISLVFAMALKKLDKRSWVT